MKERLGKIYFKRTSIAMGFIYIIMGCTLGYALCVMLLPNVARWIIDTILIVLRALSLGNEAWYLFNVGFFFACLGGLVITGIILNVVDYMNSKKENRQR